MGIQPWNDVRAYAGDKCWGVFELMSNYSSLPRWVTREMSFGKMTRKLPRISSSRPQTPAHSAPSCSRFPTHFPLLSNPCDFQTVPQRHLPLSAYRPTTLPPLTRTTPSCHPTSQVSLSKPSTVRSKPSTRHSSSSNLAPLSFYSFVFAPTPPSSPSF